MLTVRLRGVEEQYLTLSRSIEARQLQAELSSPTMKEAREAYFADAAGLSRGGSVHRTFYNGFAAMIGEDTRLAAITPKQICDYLAHEAATHKDPARATRIRAIVSRLFSWATLHHGVANPMDQVPAPRLKAEKDIQWPSLEEVGAALKGMTPYWRALIGTLAYAGLSAHELRGVRKDELTTINGQMTIRISPNADRGLKTHKRRRSIAVSKRLEPLLKAHLKGLKKDAVYLFPPLVGKSAIWHENTLSRMMNDCKHQNQPTELCRLSGWKNQKSGLRTLPVLAA